MLVGEVCQPGKTFEYFGCAEEGIGAAAADCTSAAVVAVVVVVAAAAALGIAKPCHHGQLGPLGQGIYQLTLMK